MNYVRNNVEFRIVAAKAMELYKNSQAFMLNEISGKHHFDMTSKEILLLMYDSWFQWCLFLERFCLKVNVLDKDKIDSIVLEIEAKENQYFEIMVSNPSVFRSDIVRVFRRTHCYLINCLKLVINEQQDKSSLEAYPLIINSLVKIMNSTMFELHEIDSLFKHSNIIPFVSLDEAAVEFFERTKISIPAERFKIYSEVKQVHKIFVKCYSDQSQNELETCALEPLRNYGADIQGINI